VLYKLIASHQVWQMLIMPKKNVKIPCFELPGHKVPGTSLTTYPQLALRLGNSGVIPLPLLCATWHITERTYLYIDMALCQVCKGMRLKSSFIIWRYSERFIPGGMT